MLDPHFTKSDHQTWTQLFTKQSALRDQQMIAEFSQGLKLLGITEERIPSLHDINQKLESLTGWRGRYVKGYIDAAPFFAMLKNREFPIGGFIRDAKDLSYTPEPDVFHDLYGHLPLFTVPEYADFHASFGEMGIRHAHDRDRILHFQRLFWFTCEFGLVKTPMGARVFGAGIASSFTESAYALSSYPQVQEFNLDVVRNCDFKIDTLQKVLFLLEQPAQLYSCLSEFESFYNEKATLSTDS